MEENRAIFPENTPTKSGKEFKKRNVTTILTVSQCFKKMKLIRKKAEKFWTKNACLENLKNFWKLSGDKGPRIWPTIKDFIFRMERGREGTLLTKEFINAKFNKFLDALFQEI